MSASGEADIVPRKKLAQYQFGNIIGKGGFGSVYKAFDQVTGHFVAIKQVNSGSLIELKMGSELKMEITLLSRLKHRNIVKYIDSIKTENHLNIVLEYVEGGSLASILKKFGAFPEPLCAIYTRQILTGLQYLHLQGVIHRDIKGANVLTTKKGLVKLADFGVAMKLSEVQSSKRGAVGTPFWMAPEIVEMQNPTPACDIWSVGSTVIEMATEKPPYSNLEPMQALYRIVSDPHPELPEGISKYLESFLILCFEKTPIKRPSATDLLSDDWIKRFMKSSSDFSNKSALSPCMRREDDDDEEIDEEAQTIAKMVNLSDDTEGIEQEKARTQAKPTEGRSAPASDSTKRKSINFSLAVDAKDLEVEEADSETISPTMSGTTISPTKLLTATRGEQSPKTEITSRFRFGFLDQFGRLFQTTRTDDGQSVAPDATMCNTLEATANPEKTAVIDGESEIATTTEDSIKQDNKRASLKRPDTRLPSAAFRNGDESPLQPMTKRAPEDTLAHRKEQRDAEEIKKLLSSIRPFEEPHVLVHTCKKLMDLLQPKKRGGGNDGKCNLDLVTLHGAVPIVEMLQVTDPELLHTVLKVVNRIIEVDQSFQDNFAMSGLIPAVLKFARPHHSKPLRLEAANFVSRLCDSSVTSLQMLVACGGLEALVDLVSHDYYNNRDLVLQGLKATGTVFARASSPSQKSDFCRILAKHGLCIHLTVLIDTLACDIYERASEYLKVVVDLLFLLARDGDTVVKIYMCTGQVLEGLIASLEFLPPELSVQICRTFKRLAHEPDVLNMLENAGVVPVLVHFLSLHYKRRKQTEQEEERMHNFITGAASSDDACWQCMLALHFLCKLSRARQEQAALAGVVPVLQELVESRRDLRRYAFEMISWMTGASLASRKRLWEQNGVAFFVSALAFPDLQVLALEALVDWLRVKEHHADWCERVEGILLEETKFMDEILAIFRTPKADAAVFVKILDPLLNFLRVSSGIKEALASNEAFFQELLNRFKVTHKKSAAMFLSQTGVIAENETLEIGVRTQHANSFSLNAPAPPQGATHVRRLVSESAVSAGADVRVRQELLRLLMLLCEFQTDEKRAELDKRHHLQAVMREVLHEERKKQHVITETMAQQVLDLFTFT